MRQWTRSALFQVMACRLSSAKPLPETMLSFVNRTHSNKLQWNCNQQDFSFTKMPLKMSLMMPYGTWNHGQHWFRQWCIAMRQKAITWAQVDSSSVRPLDSFTVPLHNPNSRHLAAISRAVQRDCYWGLKNGGNSHWSHQPTMQWGTRQSQSIFRPTNHKRVMLANWRPCRIPLWQSYYHQVRTV